MRLLELSPGGKCTLTRNLDHNKVPPYAILSHTWQHGQEVTYEDLVRSRRSSSTSPRPQRRPSNAAGWRKVDFCLAQTRQDGLRHCWIDSCCINKAHPDEKHGAFNAMFSWYQNAHVCYVYLQDVLVIEDLVGSRWWTRGWTLQELLAPSRVVFFTGDGVRLGDKSSLRHVIHTITRISTEALLGTQPLTQITIEEKLTWMKGRQTTFEEDWAYCLQGILGVEMSRRYGEGRLRAIERLKKEAARREAELRDITRKEMEEERRKKHEEDEPQPVEERRRNEEENELRRRAELELEKSHKELLKKPKGKQRTHKGRTEDLASYPDSNGSRSNDFFSLPSSSNPGYSASPPLARNSPVRDPNYLRDASPDSFDPRLEEVIRGEEELSLPSRDVYSPTKPKMADEAASTHPDIDFDPAEVEVTLEDLIAVGPRISASRARRR